MASCDCSPYCILFFVGFTTTDRTPAPVCACAGSAHHFNGLQQRASSRIRPGDFLHQPPADDLGGSGRLARPSSQRLLALEFARWAAVGVATGISCWRPSRTVPAPGPGRPGRPGAAWGRCWDLVAGPTGHEGTQKAPEEVGEFSRGRLGCCERKCGGLDGWKCVADGLQVSPGQGPAGGVAFV